MNSWPPRVRARVRTVLVEAAKAPPFRFSGGGYWEAMHDDMAGFYEVRVDGQDRRHYRLFCVIDSAANGAARPYLTVIGGMDKPFKTTFTARDYELMVALKDEYYSRNPRSLAGDG